MIAKRYKHKTTVNLFHHNLNIVYYIICSIAIGILIMMFRWQIIEHQKWYDRAIGQRTESQRQTSSRGVIYAADGTVLAIDEPAWNVYASLSTIKEERETFFKSKDKYIAEVAAILGVSREEISKLITDDFQYVPLSKGTSSEVKDALSNIQIDPSMPTGFGLYFERVEKRIYPDKKLASQVIGFMGKNSNNEDVGQYGIEGYYFGDLQSQAGKTYEEKDSKGNVILTTEYDPILPRAGKSITLTIRPDVQKIVQERLQSGVERNRAKSGSAIIMEVQTGKILAMANYPDYDPNEYWKISDPQIFKNRAVADVYEFGSVEKPITIAIGLESGNIKDDFICHDETGYLELYEYKIWTWNQQPSGDLSLSGILEQSNNPCASQVALNTGFPYYYQKLTEFGYGQFIGVGLQDEANSYLYEYDNWTKLDLAASAFGQAISATPLQITSAINTIVNDGKRMKPYIVSQIEDENEKITIEPKVEAEPISAETAQKVKVMMKNVVRQGEAAKVFNRDISDYDIGGKTGTAQIPKENEVGYYDDKTNTTFVGFAPYDNPKIIMLVRLQEPQISTYSSSTVVPVWIDIFRGVADSLEISKINN